MSVRIARSLTNEYVENVAKEDNPFPFDRTALIWKLVKTPNSFFLVMARMKRRQTEYNNLQLTFMESVLLNERKIEYEVDCPFCVAKKVLNPNKASFFAVKKQFHVGMDLTSCKKCKSELRKKAGKGSKIFPIRFTELTRPYKNGNRRFVREQMNSIASQVIAPAYGIKNPKSRLLLYRGEEILNLFFPEGV